MVTVDEIINELKSYNKKADTTLLQKAFDFAAEAHSGQKRRSGEPYLVHCLEVAKILTKMKMDSGSIIAAVLHDTIEDSDVTKEDVEKEFGAEVADIVDGVTKLSKLQFSNKEVRQAENYRKMILAMSRDIRVILVKLADRLHNMRTLNYMSEAKQMLIAQETLDIYCPIAGRMGIQWLKEDLSNLSLKYLKPDVYKQIEVRLSGISKKREAFMKNVTEILSKQLQHVNFKYDIASRVKKPFSIYMKMKRQQINLDEVHDIIAFRILVPSVENCYEVLGNIHSLWRPIQGRFKDYIAMPKNNNYQSLHTTVVCEDAERVEFQIRTFEMHEIAEKGIAAHWKYKENGQVDTKDEVKFRWLRQLVEWHRDLKDSLEFADAVKLDLFSDEIFVFTPKGDVKSFMHGATPVDFAYSVHSDVGNHCAGAKINGRLVPLNYVLESGDTIEIITNKSQSPNKDWLEFVETSKAKSHIRQFIRNQQRTKSIMIGRNLFDNECKKIKINSAKVLKSDDFQQYLKNKKIDSLDEYYSALAYGKVQVKEFSDHLTKQETEKVKESDNVISKIFKKVAAKNKNLVLVDGLDDVMVNFAKCCTPVKGDPIIGFVTRGRGVTVHRLDCDKVLSTDANRRLEVAWNEKAMQDRSTRVSIISEDKPGILAEVAKVISEKGVNISKLLVKTNKDGIAHLSLDVSVKSVQDLMRVIQGIENIKGVVSVNRV